MSLNAMVGNEIFNLLARLFPINRSIMGDGVRETLSIIADEYLPALKIYEIPSGTAIGDWVVPKEWNLKRGFIKNEAGKMIVDSQVLNLHVMGYSVPVRKHCSLDVLQEHLYSLTDLPNAVPYVTSYYKNDWGFCISDRERSELKDGLYEVVIDATLEDGSLTYGEIVIPGQVEDEIFFSTYICHPSLANNELSGPCLATFLARELLEQNPYYTYRFVFVPETIGSIAFIHNKGTDFTKKVLAAFNLTCLGDDNSWSLLPSRLGNTYTDRVAKAVLDSAGVQYTEYDFVRDRGSDERQYCAPGVDLPMISIMRSMYGTYPEYHTSLDNLEFVTPSGLDQSFRVHMDCIKLIEINRVYRVKCWGEPFLSKRNMNYTIVGGRDDHSADRCKEILDVFMCCDGFTDVLEIVRLTKFPITVVENALTFLTSENLIELAPSPRSF